MNGGASADTPGRRSPKSAAAFRTISEVASELDVPSHVLRFWETKFAQVRPLKRGGGRRYYRPEDVALLRRIRALLYEDGYTIKGVQKLLREGGSAEAPAKGGPPSAPAAPAAHKHVPDAATRRALEEVLRELESIRSVLRGEG